LPSGDFPEAKFPKAVQNVLQSNHSCRVIAANFLINDEGNYITGKSIGTAEKLKDIFKESLEVRVLMTK
jgi:hypothetical protein